MWIRISELDDLESIAFLFDLYRQFYHQQPDLSGAKNFLEDRMKNNESVIFVAEENNKLLGFVQLYPIFTSVGMKRSWLLNDLFVLSEHRRRGIAKMLLDKSKDLARESDASGLLLETSKNNIEGNKLYPAEGFVLESGTNFYFWKREEKN